jgi:hypothetical protein
MLAGQVPYTGDTAVSIMLKHLNEPVPPLPVRGDGTPSSLESVVVRAMAKQPDDRYQDANALLAEFERAASGNLATVVPAGDATIALPALVRRTWSRQWQGVLAVGLALMVVLAGLAVLGRQPVPATDAPRTPGLAKTSAPVALLNPPTPLYHQTFAPSMTGGPLIFKDTFGSDRGDLIWPITTVDPHIYRNIEDGAYHIRHTIPTTALPTLFDEEHQYSSPFQYEADLTISEKSQDDAAAGIIFRYKSDDQYYVFAINGQGQVSIWVRANGRWTELRDQPVNWTPAEGAKPKGQMNHLKLIDDSDQLRGYVNDNLVIDITSDPLIRSGAIGIYLATTSSQKVQNPLAEVTVASFSADYYLPSTRTATPAATPSATVATP